MGDSESTAVHTLPQVAPLSAQRLQRIIHASYGDDIDAIDPLLRLVCVRNDCAAKPELRGLLEPLLTSLDGPDLSCKTDLAENDRSIGQRDIPEGRIDRHQRGEIGRRLVDANAADGVDENIVSARLHAAMAVE